MNLSLFNTTTLFEASTNLFQQLDIKLNSNTAEALPTKDLLKSFYKDNEVFNSIRNTYFIGIIDDSVFQATGMFDVNYSIKEALQQGDKNYDGLMLFALEMNKKPTRTEISEITRAFNRISQKMPVALVLKYAIEKESVISIAISERFKYLQNWRQGEKAGKVIILRDIFTSNTHAGHQRILLDLVKPAGITNYAQLHAQWLEVLDVNILNKKFFQELANWYFWAMDKVQFPDDIEKKKDVRNATNLIRLITRVIFIWFIKEKHLVPASLFNEKYIEKILKDFQKNKKSSNYYQAILQNLFFGTLNQKMDERDFAEDHNRINKLDQGIKNKYRYPDKFNITKKEIIDLFKDIPFLNGGLFDCLDKFDEEKLEKGKKEQIFVDGFTRLDGKQAIVPDYLFFGVYPDVDLTEYYDPAAKKPIVKNVKGLIDILNNFKFTVAENTPIEEEIALDPELLGKVFENLLASYNPETKTTARKQTGSFYTPREIVNYMVDESLIEYLKGVVSIPAHELNQKQDAFETFETFFNPNNEILIHTGNLPHWQQENVWYFVTFRLADSIPAEIAEQIKSEREIWLKNNKKNQNGEYSKEQIKEYYRLFSDRIENLLNNGRGSCVLKNPDISKIVADALNHFNNQRYVLDEWVIMPNHVHILFKPLGENKLPDILHSWKSYTANEINKITGNKGQFWMHESYDHIVRNEKALEAIRNYIWQNPVKAKLAEGEYLLSRSRDASDTFDARLRNLFSYNDEGNPLNSKETDELIEAINNAKILDPACGSGAFPMGVLHKMVHLLQKLDPGNVKWKAQQKEKIIGNQIKELEKDKKAIAGLSDKAVREKAIQAVDERLKEIDEIFESKNNFDDYARKLYLIENCIYGIDIQPIAVQISKLRFFISLIIDQKAHPSSLMDGKQKENRGIRPLPNLETKFVAANTLISLEKPKLVTGDIFIQDTLNFIKEKSDQLKEIRHNYFNARLRKDKLQFQSEDKKLRKEISEMLVKIGYTKGNAFNIASFDPYDQNHFANWFEPEWMFGNEVKDGFDIVIGNPPYLNVEKIDETIKSNISKFRTAYQKYDLYVLFYEKAIDLLKQNGQLNYITSNKFLSQGYGLLLRQEFLKFHINQIINFNYDIFEAATVRTCIFHLQKTNFSNRNIKIIDVATQKDSDKFTKLLFNHLDQNIFNETDENNFRINLTNQKIEILSKISRNTIKVEDVCSVNYGLRPSSEKLGKKKEAFIYENNPNKKFKKYFEGKDMGYWKIKAFSYLDYRPDVMYNSMFPELFENDKLVGLRTLSDIEKLRFIYDEDKFYCNDSVVVLTLWHLFSKVKNQTIQRNISLEKIKKSKSFSYYYIQGILNSKLIKYYVNELLYDGTHFYPNHMKSLPIKDISLDEQSPLITVVDKIHNKLKTDIITNVSDLEKQIDDLVYKLYDLTEEEIKIIEGNE